ncbi:EAL domain-containing protein, partial [Lactobacillus delbrueckii]
MIHKLDLHILDLVCQDLEEAMQKGETYPMVSVNLSRYDLELPDLHERINNILASHRVKSSQIRIEITESALLSNTEAVIKEHISRFHEDGYQVWLDDFGSGFSSLNSLQNFDFDLLKIDMAFLRHANEKTPTILMDVIDMAKRLGIETLSEGVETKDEYDFLHSIGCVLAQGFYFSQPLPKDKITAKRKERGLEFESLAEYAFYKKIGQINVLNALYPFSGKNDQELAETVPVMLLLDKGGDLEPIYSNKAAQNWCQSLRLRALTKDQLRHCFGYIRRLTRKHKPYPHSSAARCMLYDEIMWKVIQKDGADHLDIMTAVSGKRKQLKLTGPFCYANKKKRGDV